MTKIINVTTRDGEMLGQLTVPDDIIDHVTLALKTAGGQNLFNDGVNERAFLNVEQGFPMHPKLKADIAEWQGRTDEASLGDDPLALLGLLQEARTLLLRCSQSL